MRPVLGSGVGEAAVQATGTTRMMIDSTWVLDDSRYRAIASRLAARIAAEFVREGFAWVAVRSNGLHESAGVEDFVGGVAAL